MALLALRPYRPSCALCWAGPTGRGAGVALAFYGLGFLLLAAVYALSLVRDLVAGQAITRELRGGGTHTYRIFVNKGFFLQVTPDQRVIDVVLTLRGPDGEKISDNDSNNGAWGPETMSWVANVAGEYEIQVSSFEERATTGHYELKAEVPRQANDSDRARLNAEQVSRKALLLAKEQKPESWRKAREEYLQVQRLWHALSDSYQEGLSLDMLGSLNMLLDDKKEALAEYSKALEIWNLRNDRRRRAEDLEMIGNTRREVRGQRSGATVTGRIIASAEGAERRTRTGFRPQPACGIVSKR